MFRVAAFARWLLLFLCSGLVFPIIVNWTRDNPAEAKAGVMSAIYWFGGLPWVYPAALVLVGATIGVWLDWVLRGLDNSRQAKRKVIGREMISLGRAIQHRQEGYHGSWPENVHSLRPNIMSAFIKVEQIGIWAPTDQPYEMGQVGANVMINYLGIVGTMLADGHFPQAKKRAMQLKEAIESGVLDATGS